VRSGDTFRVAPPDPNWPVDGSSRTSTVRPQCRRETAGVKIRVSAEPHRPRVAGGIRFPRDDKRQSCRTSKNLYMTKQRRRMPMRATVPIRRSPAAMHQRMGFLPLLLSGRSGQHSTRSDPEATRAGQARPARRLGSRNPEIPNAPDLRLSPARRLVPRGGERPGVRRIHRRAKSRDTPLGGLRSRGTLVCVAVYKRGAEEVVRLARTSGTSHSRGVTRLSARS
jgi:hypothetical protein